jgi:hypothetical protein
VQADRRRIAQAFRDVHGIRAHGKDGAALERGFPGSAQGAVIAPIQRVLLRSGEHQYRRPGAVIVRRGAPAVGKAHLEQREARRAVEDLARIAADARNVRERALDRIDLVAKILEHGAHRAHRVGGLGRFGAARHQFVHLHRSTPRAIHSKQDVDATTAAIRAAIVACQTPAFRR